jgi:transposase
VHAAVDTLGHLLALRVSPANEDDRKQVEKLAEQIQQATQENIEIAYVDQGYTGERASELAAEHGIRLEVVKHEEAKRGFVLLPRRWVVERDFAWASRFLGDWLRIMRGCPRRWRGSTSSRSLASFFSRRPASSSQVHNTL